MADKLYSELNKGEWSNSTAYTIGDFISYNGSSYTCIADSTNNTPPNATYWALLASKGDTGSQGTQGVQGVQGPQGVPGDMAGPASSTDNRVAVFDGTTGKVVKDGGKTIAQIEASSIPTSYLDTDTTLAANSDTKIATQKAVKAYGDRSLINTLKIAPINAPQGFLLNGKIVPSVASNNLTVVIKGLDGNDPSASNPVYCRIGDTVRSITSALSVTKNAGTNWCNAGSAELATKEIDYFVYLGYNATDGVVIGFSRIPYATLYSDFSATTTNEKYAGISTITTAAAGDAYENIGRFAATLSAGAGYTWSVPTFTTANLIQRPIYETRWLTYVPTLTWTAGAAPTTLNSGYSESKYKIISNICNLHNFRFYDVAGTTVTGADFTLPITQLNSVGTSIYPCSIRVVGTTGLYGSVAVGYLSIKVTSGALTQVGGYSLYSI